MHEPSDPSIVMTLLVRNEQDIIAENILFHHHQGVQQFIVMDNLSSDDTVAIVKELSEWIPIELIHQEADTYSQGEWVTEMARSAATKYKADWVINNDADEFWMFPSGDAKSYLSKVDQGVDGILVKRHNALLRKDFSRQGWLAHPAFSDQFDVESFNQLGQSLPGKCLHRALPGITVEQGNHSIQGHQGRIDHCSDLFILHFPYRRFDHYCNKIRLGGAAYGRNDSLDPQVGITWRQHYAELESSSLDNFWTRLQYSRQACIGRQSRGDLLTDQRLKDALEMLLPAHQQRQLIRLSGDLVRDTSILVNRYVTSAVDFVSDLDDPEPRSLHHNNLPFLVQGPQSHEKGVRQWVDALKRHDPLQRFSDLRDLISLFPQNQALVDWMASLLAIRLPHVVRLLKQSCGSGDLILHVSCRQYLSRAQQSVESFRRHGYRSVVVVGSDVNEVSEFGFEFDGQILTLPVPDGYEDLATKVFHAYLILSLCTDVRSVVKVDDDIRLHDPERFERLLRRMRKRDQQCSGKLIRVAHRDQCHGWHIGKCGDERLNQRGYQFPMPRVYASGGFGYVLRPQALQSCALMYLTMRAFFGMNCVQLEDVFVGLCLEGSGIRCASCEYEPFENPEVPYPDAAFAVLPGLSRLPDD